jgi:hypothetical protein
MRLEFARLPTLSVSPQAFGRRGIAPQLSAGSKEEDCLSRPPGYPKRLLNGFSVGRCGTYYKLNQWEALK